MNDELDMPKLMYNWAKDLPPKVINRVSPSQVGGCMRAHWYSIKHAPVTTPTNPGYILNMQTGFMWEKIIIDSLKNAGVPFIEQWKMSSEKYNMEGTLDFAIVKTSEDGVELEIWDSKTENSLAHKYRDGSYLDSHEEYVHQLNSYALMARDLNFTVRRGGFIVVRRDDSFIEQVPFVYDDLRLQKTENRIKQLNKHLKNNTLPPCDGKFCKIGLCAFGNPETQAPNKKGKLMNTECCPLPRELKNWADKLEVSHVE